MIIAALLIGFASAVVLLWSIFKHHAVSDALVDSYPEEFREETLWRIAFPILVFSPLTPLHLQLDCLKSQTGSCCATLGISVSCFLFGGITAGWITLIMFVGLTIFLIGYWRTYRANRARKIALNDKEQT
jgi:hypothetical protein